MAKCCNNVHDASPLLLYLSGREVQLRSGVVFGIQCRAVLMWRAGIPRIVHTALSAPLSHTTDTKPVRTGFGQITTGVPTTRRLPIVSAVNDRVSCGHVALSSRYPAGLATSWSGITFAGIWQPVLVVGRLS